MIIIFSSVGFFIHNIFIYFTSILAAHFSLFDIRMTQEISETEIGNGKFLGMANCNIYFKTDINI